MINITLKPKKQLTWRLRKIKDMHLIINLFQTYELSETGYRILELSDGEHTITNIIEDLVTTFGVDREIVTHDCIEFLEKLAEKKIINF